MSDATIRFKLHGEVTAEKLAAGLRWASSVMHALEGEILDRDSNLSRRSSSRKRAAWLVDDLNGGSAETTLRAPSLDTELARRLEDGFDAMGESMVDRTPPPFSPHLQGLAASGRALIGDGVTHLEIGTPRTEPRIILADADHEILTPEAVLGFGSVVGRVETLQSRNTLAFQIYDEIYDRAVTCHISKDQTALLDGTWTRRAEVVGQLHFHAKSGYLLKVQPVDEIKLLPESGLDLEPHAYFGVAPPGDEPSEVRVRREREEKTLDG